MQTELANVNTAFDGIYTNWNTDISGVFHAKSNAITDPENSSAFKPTYLLNMIGADNSDDTTYSYAFD